MDLNKLIDKGVNLAFKTVDSLAVTATFHLKTVGGFNYGTGRPSVSGQTDVTARVIVLDSRKKSDNVEYKNLLVKSEPLAELDLYDKVTVHGQTWTLGLPIVDNGKTQLLEIFKGV